ncbi:hypothetical protein F5148DRAFT_1235404 [Russula earlei]|uniref:Uncharacterized protein n=1 Tax=Russula earlei TaxID=71964 RepID=A0ACC0TZU3_9AGAM|nr:hypothetical protein F5148DRAFT_1235404 [Russula earlei]
MNLHDEFSDSSIISCASGIVRSPTESSTGSKSPVRSDTSPVSIIQRQRSTPPPTQSPPAGLDSDWGILEKLIPKTSQTSLRDTFSEASIDSRAHRSSSVAHSLREATLGALGPTQSIASPRSILQRRTLTPSRSHSPVVTPNRDVRAPSGAFPKEEALQGSPYVPTSNMRPPSPEREESEHDFESALRDVTAPSHHSRPLSPAGSITTRALVAAAAYSSATVSPVSSARSIFGKAPSITSTTRARAATGPAFGVASIGLAIVSPTQAGLVATLRSRASSVRSISTDAQTGGRPDSISPSPVKTISPPPSHDVGLSSYQHERLRTAPADNHSRVDSIPKSRASERFHSPEPGSLRQPSPPESTRKAEPRLAEKLSTSPSPSPTVGATYPSTQNQQDLAPGERFVSYVYCRMCRRDPCRQPAATMCGHVFCYQCISSEVVKNSRCPVCEAPTLLYSIFKLHLA